MDPTLKKLLDALAAKSQEANTLLAKETLDEADAKRLSELTKDGGEIDQAQAAFDERKAQVDKANKTKSFIDEPSLPALVKSNSNKGTTQPVDTEDKGDQPKERKSVIDRGARVGTELVKLGALANFRLDMEGGEFGDKKLLASMEPGYHDALIRVMHCVASKREPEKADLKAIEVGLDTQGGYLVPPQWFGDIIGPDPAEISLLDIVTTVPTISDLAQWPVNKYSSANANDIYTNAFRKVRTGEAAAPEDAGNLQLGLAEIPVHEGRIEVAMTRSMMEDRANIENYVVSELRSSFRLGTEDEIANGNGVKKPHGILANPAGNTDEPPTQNLGHPVTADGLLDLFYGTPRQYRASSQLVCNDTDVYRTWAKLKDSDGNYIFGLRQNTDGGLATPRGETFLGKPIRFCPFYPNSGSAANVASFGDHRRAYYYALRVGMTIEFQNLPRESYVYAVLRFRDGGDVVQPRAILVGVQS